MLVRKLTLLANKTNVINTNLNFINLLEDLNVTNHGSLLCNPFVGDHTRRHGGPSLANQLSQWHGTRGVIPLFIAAAPRQTRSHRGRREMKVGRWMQSLRSVRQDIPRAKRANHNGDSHTLSSLHFFFFLSPRYTTEVKMSLALRHGISVISWLSHPIYHLIWSP